MQVNHLDVVQRVHAQFPPSHTPSGAVIFVLQVIDALPSSEGAGLLQKTAGDNIVPYGETMVSAGRICYPNGQLYKVLTDIPTTMAPQWLDDGTVDPARYISVHAEQPEDGGGGQEPGKDAELIAALLKLCDAGDRIVDGMDKLIKAQDALRDTVNSVNEHGVRVRLG